MNWKEKRKAFIHEKLVGTQVTVKALGDGRPELGKTELYCPIPEYDIALWVDENPASQMLPDHFEILDRAIGLLQGPNLRTREDIDLALKNLEELQRRTNKYRRKPARKK